jgi:hypothetical protein
MLGLREGGGLLQTPIHQMIDKLDNDVCHHDDVASQSYQAR